MNTDLSELRKRTVPVNDYIESLEQPFRGRFTERMQSYRLDSQIIKNAKSLNDRYFIVVFSASWCKDCAKNVPVLAILSQETSLEIRVFGGIKKDPLSHTRKWRIPPSPLEVETFQVEKLPTIIVFDKQGHEAGRIVEGPKQLPTLEQELLRIMTFSVTERSSKSD